MAANLQLLKHTGFYFVDNADGTQSTIQFKALVRKDYLFTVPVAEFKWQEGGKVLTAENQFLKGVVYPSGEIPFEVVYKNGNWYADIRSAN